MSVWCEDEEDWTGMIEDAVLRRVHVNACTAIIKTHELANLAQLHSLV